MVSDKNIFSCFPYISLCKTWPPGGAQFWPKGHNLNKPGRGTLDQTKILSRKSIYSLCDLDMQRTRTICTLIKEGNIRIIPAKFGVNRASCLGDVLWSNWWRHTTDDGHPMITIAHHEPMAQVSLKCQLQIFGYFLGWNWLSILRKILCLRFKLTKKTGHDCFSLVNSHF